MLRLFFFFFLESLSCYVFFFFLEKTFVLRFFFLWKGLSCYVFFRKNFLATLFFGKDFSTTFFFFERTLSGWASTFVETRVFLLR